MSWMVRLVVRYPASFLLHRFYVNYFIRGGHTKLLNVYLKRSMALMKVCLHLWSITCKSFMRVFVIQFKMA